MKMVLSTGVSYLYDQKLRWKSTHHISVQCLNAAFLFKVAGKQGKSAKKSSFALGGVYEVNPT